MDQNYHYETGVNVVLVQIFSSELTIALLYCVSVAQDYHDEVTVDIVLVYSYYELKGLTTMNSNDCQIMCIVKALHLFHAGRWVGQLGKCFLRVILVKSVVDGHHSSMN